MTCEVCGETRHSGNYCPELHEDLNFINNNNGFRQQNQGWNQHSNSQGNNLFPRSNIHNSDDFSFLKNLVYSQGRTTEFLNKKLMSNDKMLENINAKLEDFSSALKINLALIRC